MTKKNQSAISKKIAQDDNYERTRENMAEFERAVRAATLLNDAFRDFDGSDTKVLNRLTSIMHDVVKSDPLSPRGERKVSNGDLSLLRRFEFNLEAKMRRILRVSGRTSTIDRATGALTINIPEFIPKRVIIGPRGATHFKLICYGAAIDFVTETYTDVVATTAELAYGKQTEAAASLSVTLPGNGTSPLFMAFGISFYQLVNGAYSPLHSKTYNALAIELIDTPVAG